MKQPDCGKPHTAERYRFLMDIKKRYPATELWPISIVRDLATAEFIQFQTSEIDGRISGLVIRDGKIHLTYHISINGIFDLLEDNIPEEVESKVTIQINQSKFRKFLDAMEGANDAIASIGKGRTKVQIGLGDVFSSSDAVS